MSSKHQKGPDLKRFMDKRLKLSLNGNRKIVGTLRGYDGFLNVVLENAVDEATGADLCGGGGGGGGGSGGGEIVIRGNSIIQFESVERITTAAST